MLHVITLFTVPVNEDAFVNSMSMNGDWHTLARSVAPELIATDLLRHQLSSLYLCHDLWTTREAYVRGVHLPAIQNLFLMRRLMAAACFELGAFQFPALAECITFLTA